MFQTATNPFAQPTAISLGESQARQVQTVEGGLHENAADVTLSMF